MGDYSGRIGFSRFPDAQQASDTVAGKGKERFCCGQGGCIFKSASIAYLNCQTFT